MNDRDETAYLTSDPENARHLQESLEQARGYRPQDLPQSDPEPDGREHLAAVQYGPANPPPEDDSEGWLPIDTYSVGPNLRVVALECASRACAPAGGSSGIRSCDADGLIAYASKLLGWLEADA